jgi:hypothetical protein
MDPFPEEFELIGFFESEPEVSDRDVPWFYNCLTFRAKRDDSVIVCSIEPGYGEIDLTWKKSGNEVANFSLQDISSLLINLNSNNEYMTVKFKYEDMLDFVLYLKPEIRIQWGNQKRL